jgi:glycosyltransferase involved in cell wall biosynthesis
MREAIALREAGYAVTVVDLERDHTRPREEDVNGIHLKHIVMPGRFVSTRFKPWFLVKMGIMVMRGTAAVVRTPADVYHAHDDTALPACYVAAQLRRKSLVFDAHELPLVQPNLTRLKRLCMLARWALRRMMPRCNSVITVSPPIVGELQRRYGGRTAVLVRNVPQYTEPVVGDHLRAYLDLGSTTQIALYQGGLQENRCLDTLVYAARFLDPGHVIVLMGSGESKTKLQMLIEREEVSDRVKIIPPVPYHDLLAWTASADLGLIVYRGSYSPNVQLCLPNKLFEYLMAGVPILASSLDAVAEIIQAYDVGTVVSSLDPCAVGQAISAMLSDHETLARMRCNALNASRQDLRWEKECDRLVGVYRDVVGAG